LTHKHLKSTLLKHLKPTHHRKATTVKTKTLINLFSHSQLQHKLCGLISGYY